MKKIKYLCIILSIFILFIISCDSKLVESFNLLENIDYHPPQLKYIESNSPYSIEVLFNEPLATKDKSSFYLDNKKKSNYNIKANTLTYFQQQELIPGEKHNIKVTVQDLNGNSTEIESFCYTKNNNPAKLLISEISTKGTSLNCDKVELVAVNRGSVAGFVIADGFNDNYKDRIILPNIYVNEGDFIVISFKNKENDFYVSENQAGLSSNNGCILILDNPSYNAKVMDAIIYSNKSSESCEGFANENTLNTAKKLVALSMWELTNPLSDGAVNTTYETSTRTINRKFVNNFFFIDTNTKEDFYTTVTKGATFGKMNNINEYLVD